MAIHMALLRGVNVGGQQMAAMAEPGDSGTLRFHTSMQHSFSTAILEADGGS